jgi:hypothetical protein
MQTPEQLNWLKEEIGSLVARYRNESARYKKHAIVLKIISVFLAALITVLLGLKLRSTGWVEVLSNVALFLGATITVLSAYEAFFDPRALWVRETITFVRLKDLQRDLQYWEAGQDPEKINAKELASFKSRLDSILEDTLKHWMKLRGAPELEKRLEARAELRTKDHEAES